MQTEKKYFDTHPHRNEVFRTADGLLFHEEGDAKLHDDHTGKKGVTRILRNDVIVVPQTGDKDLDVALANAAAESEEPTVLADKPQVDVKEFVAEQPKAKTTARTSKK